MPQASIKDQPANMVIDMRMRRDNFRSPHLTEGSDDAAADAIFNRTLVEVSVIEYNMDSAGGLEPLRLIATGHKRVVAGFTTKTGD